jgi:hypothetical protein
VAIRSALGRDDRPHRRNPPVYSRTRSRFSRRRSRTSAMLSSRTRLVPLRSSRLSLGLGLFLTIARATEPRPLVFFALMQDIQDLEQRPGARFLNRQLDGIDRRASLKAMVLLELFELLENLPKVSVD